MSIKNKVAVTFVFLLGTLSVTKLLSVDLTRLTRDSAITASIARTVIIFEELRSKRSGTTVSSIKMLTLSSGIRERLG